MSNKEFDAVLILPYYGQYPIWIRAFLRSCSFNTKLKWMIFSDIEVPDYQPANVEFIHLKRESLSKLIFEKTNIKHTLQDPHKLCDFKPLYGHIFEDYLKGHTYWGHCDMDVIWGDMASFLAKISFEQYDIISTRPRVICGHFTLYRNIPNVNHFYKQVPHYQKAFEKLHYQGFDEGFFSYHLFMEIERRSVDLNVFWKDRNCLDPGELSRMPDGWQWKSGKVKNKWGNEGNYLHLIKWKKTIEEAEIECPEKTFQFHITQLGLWKGEIPLKYRRLLRKSYGIINQLRFIKYQVTYFLRRNLWRQKEEYKPNVLPQYQRLNNQS